MKIELNEFLFTELGNEGHSAAVVIFNQLPEIDKEAFYKYAHTLYCDFSEVGNWENGQPPTLEQSKENILFLINEFQPV